MNIKELIYYGTKEIKKANIENASLQSKMLLSYLLKKPKEYLIVKYNENINSNIEEEYKMKIKKITEGYPIQYVINHQEFMKLDFYVDENVLIPQPDTEILVEEVINICKNYKDVSILDMCTGSGAIAISLAKYIEKSNVYALDISEDALNIARKNAIYNNVQDKITFLKSDMFEKIPNIKFDIIVSNPPYIESNAIVSLSKQVKYEPHIALDGGLDGLNFYKIISNNAHKFLKNDGYICLEIGYNQRTSVTDILVKSNKYEDIYYKNDLNNNNRIIIARDKQQ